MAEKNDVISFKKRPGFVPTNQEALTLRPTPNYVPHGRRGASASGETINISKRNNHAIMYRRLHPDSLVREIEYPANCIMCYHQEGIEEVLENGQWWWHCPECDHKWDPIEALD